MAQRKARQGDPRVAVGYIRVSTTDQHLGPEAQRAAIGAWAAREGVTVAAWCEDAGVSGGMDLGDRPGLVAALGELRLRGAGALAVAKRDRLARDVYVAVTIERAIASEGARVVCADGVANGDTPADAFLRTILDGAAAYERELIRGRTRAALAVKRGRGLRVGGIPYGFQLAADGRALSRHEGEQRVLGIVRAYRAQGLVLRQIGIRLEGLGLLPRSSKHWHPQTLSRIAEAA